MLRPPRNIEDCTGSNADERIRRFSSRAATSICRRGAGGQASRRDTIKAFVRAVWETDTVITANKLPHPSQVWSKPDLRTGSLELRRITTRESISSAAFPHGVR